MIGKVMLDSFQSVRTVTTRTFYADLKAEVLEVGRFSCFEATASDIAARMYTRLCHDPEIETFDMGYPWTGVRLKP